MVKASELIKEQQERETWKNKTFSKIYTNIDKKIIIASSANNYYTWYQIPEFIVGLPLYNLLDCKLYIENKLKENGFITEFFEPNILFITWFPKKN